MHHTARVCIISYAAKYGSVKLPWWHYEKGPSCPKRYNDVFMIYARPGHALAAQTWGPKSLASFQYSLTTLLTMPNVMNIEPGTCMLDRDVC